MEFVQLGFGFMRIFVPILKLVGYSFKNYFTIRQPRELIMTFDDLKKRTNSPFVLSLKRHSIELLTAEVYGFFNTNW